MTHYYPQTTPQISEIQVPERTLGIRILLIEDNDNNRMLLGDYLNLCGYQVQALANGATLADALLRFQPHLILLDLKLPDVDGFTILRMLRTHPEWSRIPVIVISAMAFREDQQRALGLGARRYLVKPIKLSGLREAIYEEFQRSFSSDH